MRLHVFNWIVMVGFLATSACCLGVALGDPLRDSLQREVLENFPTASRISVERIRTSVHFKDSKESGRSRWVIRTLLPRPAVGLVSFEAERKSKVPLLVSGTAFVKVWSKIAVASSPVINKSLFTENNTRFEERELGEIGVRGFFVEAKDLVGKHAKGYISTGQALGLHNTDTPPEVETGNLIELVSKKGTLQVSAKVKAIDTGRLGDTIRVENSASRRVLRAKVTGNNMVEVY